MYRERDIISFSLNIVICNNIGLHVQFCDCKTVLLSVLRLAFVVEGEISCLLDGYED